MAPRRTRIAKPSRMTSIPPPSDPEDPPWLARAAARPRPRPGVDRRPRRVGAGRRGHPERLQTIPRRLDRPAGQAGPNLDGWFRGPVPTKGKIGVLGEVSQWSLDPETGILVCKGDGGPRLAPLGPGAGRLHLPRRVAVHPGPRQEGVQLGDLRPQLGRRPRSGTRRRPATPRAASSSARPSSTARPKRINLVEAGRPTSGSSPPASGTRTRSPARART